MTVEPLSHARKEAVSELMLRGSDGDFVIVHQEHCCYKSSNTAACTCVPDVWRVQRAKS